MSQTNSCEETTMTESCKRKRVVILCGPHERHEATCATIIQSGIHVVGICRSAPKKGNLPFATALRWIKRGRFIRTVGQILGRVVYSIFRKARDRRIFNTLYDVKRNKSIIDQWGGEIFVSPKELTYDTPETIEKILSWKPDILMVHTGAWVGKKVREIPADQLVIGGHPGITPYYRGAHSAFWAIYNGKPEDIGWSVFHLDSGVDTGDLITQGRIEIAPDDSYMTLSWKAMIALANAQVEAILKWEKTGKINRQKHETIPDGSEYPVPGLFAHWKYWRQIKNFKNRHRNIILL